MEVIQIKSINQVIFTLDEIISNSIKTSNPLGYFAALYRNVTAKVKEAIDNDYFDDGKRMEKLDVIFAKRYIDAYYAWQNKEIITNSWLKAFDLSTSYWPIVLQHLLIGMNAHINLDLGIAAAEVSKNCNIHDLEDDFKKINKILSSLVHEVQNDLAEMWPTLKKILQITKQADDFLVDFSMELAREGAWKFALVLASSPDLNIEAIIKSRDEIIVKKAGLIMNPGILANIIFKIIRLGEMGTIEKRIMQLAKI
jgi:hypothetical protein